MYSKPKIIGVSAILTILIIFFSYVLFTIMRTLDYIPSNIRLAIILAFIIIVLIIYLIILVSHLIGKKSYALDNFFKIR